MPLALKHDVNDSATWLLWEIKEPEGWFLENLIVSTAELKDFQSIVSEKRRLEWLAGRMAAQSLCQQLDIVFKGIGKQETGKPVLVESSFEISLSHCYPYAVAYIHKKSAVGVDLDMPREKMRNVANRVFNESELSWANGDLNRICQLWCGKETLFKIYAKRGLIFKEDIELTFQDQVIVGIVKKNGFLMEYQIEFYNFNNHFICYNR